MTAFAALLTLFQICRYTIIYQFLATLSGFSLVIGIIFLLSGILLSFEHLAKSNSEEKLDREMFRLFYLGVIFSLPSAALFFDLLRYGMHR